MDRNRGILSLNLSERFLSYFNDLDVDINYHIQKLFKKSFFIIQIRVSDQGMIPLSSLYYFQIYFCINIKQNSYEKYLKHKTYYCDFDTTDDGLNKYNKIHQLKMKSLVNSLIENNHFGDIIINESKLVKQTFVYKNNHKNSMIITTTSSHTPSTKQSAKKSNKISTISNQNFVTTITRFNNNINSNTNTMNKNFFIFMNSKKQTTFDLISTTKTTSINKLKAPSSVSTTTSKTKFNNNENEDYDYPNKSVKSKLISTTISNYFLIIFLIIFL